MLKTSLDVIIKDLESVRAHIVKMETQNRRLTRERVAAEMDVTTPPVLNVHPAPVTPAHPSAETRRTMAVAFAVSEWELGVSEPPGPNSDRIGSEYISGPDGLGWSWVDPYTENGQFAWCGAFASYCFGKAGLLKDIRHKVLPSCYRLFKWASLEDRMVKPAQVMRGDIVVVGNDKSREWGSHITICQKTSSLINGVRTIEGNARGASPNGDRWEGVVKQYRPINPEGDEYRVLYGVRLQGPDFGLDEYPG